MRATKPIRQITSAIRYRNPSGRKVTSSTRKYGTGRKRA